MNTNTQVPTNQGTKSIGEILDMLEYSSYAANRDYGMTHEQAISIGLGNEYTKAKYEAENNN